MEISPYPTVVNVKTQNYANRKGEWEYKAISEERFSQYSTEYKFAPTYIDCVDEGPIQVNIVIKHRDENVESKSEDNKKSTKFPQVIGEVINPHKGTVHTDTMLYHGLE